MRRASRLWSLLILSMAMMASMVSALMMTTSRRPCAVPSTVFSRVMSKALHTGTVNNNNNINTNVNSCQVMEEEVVFRGYRDVVRRVVRLPNGKQASFDVLRQRHQSVVVFVWDTKTSTTTLIREYHPGPNRDLFGTVAGMYEPHKHRSPLESAQHELEEEAQLRSEQWFSLLDESKATAGMPFDKYSNNHFFPYLALDCSPVLDPKPLDEEEFIEIERNVSYGRLTEIMRAGEMNVVSTFAIMLGLQKLTEMGIPYGDNNSTKRTPTM